MSEESADDLRRQRDKLLRYARKVLIEWELHGSEISEPSLVESLVNLGEECGTLDRVQTPDDAQRYYDAAKYLMTCLWGAAARGGWTREDISAVARDAVKKWPELEPGKQ